MSSTRPVFFTFLFILYLFQGILYGLQVKFLPVFLRTRGFSLSFIGSLNLLALPWITRTLWAPLIDLYWTATSWLKLFLVGTSTTLLMLHQAQHSTVMFAAVLVAVNVFSASLELVIGKIVLGQLDKNQLRTASCIKVLAYKSGILLGGGCTLWISSTLGNQVFLIASTMFLVLFLLIFLLPKNYIRQPEVRTSRDDQTHRPEVIVKRSNPVYRSMSRGSKWMITCLLMYKYASHSSHMLFTMALVDQGIGVVRIGLMSGVVGHAMSLVVALLVGITLSNNRFSAIRILHVVSVMDLLCVMAQIWMAFKHDIPPSLTVFLLFAVQHAVLGAQTTPVSCLVLTHCQREPSSQQATQHSLYTTLETIGSKFSLFLTGLLAEYLGYMSSLCISLFVAVCFVGVVGHGRNDDEYSKKEE